MRWGSLLILNSEFFIAVLKAINKNNKDVVQFISSNRSAVLIAPIMPKALQ